MDTSMNLSYGVFGMIRVVLGILLLLADLAYMKNMMSNWSYLPFTSLIWSALFGLILFIRQGKISDFVWILSGVVVIAIISGGMILDILAIKTLVIQIVFGFFAGTVIGAGILEFQLRHQSMMSSWYNVASIISGLGCLILTIVGLMAYVYAGKYDVFAKNAMFFSTQDNTVISNTLIISVLFSAAIGFLFSYGIRFSLFAMIFLIIGIIISLSFHGFSWDILFAAISIILGFIFGNGIGMGVKHVGERINKEK